MNCCCFSHFVYERMRSIICCTFFFHTIYVENRANKYCYKTKIVNCDGSSLCSFAQGLSLCASFRAHLNMLLFHCLALCVCVMLLLCTVSSSFFSSLASFSLRQLQAWQRNCAHVSSVRCTSSFRVLSGRNERIFIKKERNM